jgi:hypothetical protein
MGVGLSLRGRSRWLRIIGTEVGVYVGLDVAAVVG